MLNQWVINRREINQLSCQLIMFHETEEAKLFALCDHFFEGRGQTIERD